MWGTEEIFNFPYTICSFFTGKEENQEKKKGKGLGNGNIYHLKYIPLPERMVPTRGKKRG